MKNQIEIPEDFEVKFTVRELIQYVKHLETGQFLFVNPLITSIEFKIEQQYAMKNQSTEGDPKPIGGGGGGSPKPPKPPTQ